jgi:hypothetical protein
LDWDSWIIDLLHKWAAHAEQYWYPMPDAPEFGCYGTGYNAWGVQTNQKYLSAMAVLGVLGTEKRLVEAGVCALARERALAALRFSLHSHVSGDYVCTDGTQWGHTWISGLGIERMMHGVYLLEPYLTDTDRRALREVLVSEADWLLYDYHRGTHYGVTGGLWNHSGKNVPESNLWNGAILWRAATMYPDHPHVMLWREEAHQFLINAVSVPADADDERIVAGKMIRERHVGANFFPNYALDHHGYLNVGYMVICLSNAAMLHFGMRALGKPTPASLYHHQAELWQVVRRFVFADGRLARIGGDSRLRYTYCQEYLLPTLVYAADQFDEPYAGQLLAWQLEWIDQEAKFGNEGSDVHHGSFYGRRIAPLIEQNPYYYTRLESDRACALGMVLAFVRHLCEGELRAEPSGTEEQTFARSVAGTWCEAEHGAVLHRGAQRLVSFAWRAHGLAQGMCTPPDGGHLAEWSYNLAGLARFLGDDGTIAGGQTRHRELLAYHIEPFEGGFATCGTIAEGVDIRLAEGWQGDRSALHWIAFVALPDGHTAVGLQRCQTDKHRTYLVEAKGLHLNLPNDLFNGFERRLVTERGEVVLRCPPERDQVVDLNSLWANVEERLGVVGLYGGDHLVVHQSMQRRGGKYASLHVDEICLGCVLGTRVIEANTVILDAGWTVLSAASVDQTRLCADSSGLIDLGDATLRAVRVRGLDGVLYVVFANLGDGERDCSARELSGKAAGMRDLVLGEPVDRRGTLRIGPAHARVFALDSMR